MKSCDYIWLNGEYKKWDDSQIHVLTHGLHYGSAVFEGMRLYETNSGSAIFRLEDHLNRLFYSANCIGIKPKFTLVELRNSTIDLVKRNGLVSGYIRPLIYYGYGKMGLNPIGAPDDYLIAAWEWGKYLKADAVRCCISKYMRLHPDSVISDAKISGYYSNSILASLDATNNGYDEAILMDYKGNVAEGPGENVFIVKNGILKTPAKGAILPGLTRATVIEIAQKNDISVIETDITKQELYEADEVFLTGTAAEITPVAQIDQNTIANGKMGVVTEKIKNYYIDVVTGKYPEFNKYLTYV